jgi:F-type H+-transporting ATPase subunit b
MFLASNFLVPNGTFIVELVVFLLVLAVLGKYVVPRVNTIIEDRQGVIRQALVDAEDAKRRSEEAEAEYARVIEQARSEARSVIDEANRVAEQLRVTRREQAEREYETIISRARTDIEAEARRAAEELRQQVADIVIAVVERVIGDGLDAQAQRNLIDRTIAEVEAEARGAGVGA